MSSGPQVDSLAAEALPRRGSSTLQTRGQNQQWPSSGQLGYITAVLAALYTSEWGHINGGQQVGKVATQSLPWGGGGFSVWGVGVVCAGDATTKWQWP